MKIAVVGAGYVGLSNAILMAQHNQVVVLDIAAERVALLNRRRAPIEDATMHDYLAHRQLDLRATLDGRDAYADADYVVVATPTDFDPRLGSFDTRSLDGVIRDVVAVNPDTTIVIKSTVPVGYTAAARRAAGTDRIIFVPEFLREGNALHDSLHPGRIIVGDTGEPARVFARLLHQGAIRQDIPTRFTSSAEAEAIKLFSNAWLAMRVAFFNELDSYAAIHGLGTRAIVDGVCLDPRIGAHYNNPSFGYGGYCLPKDTRLLLKNCEDVPQNLIRAVVEANATRKDFIVADILRRNPGTIGIFRLVMKAGSDNFRSSAILDIMGRLRAEGARILIFEPILQGAEFRGIPVIRDLDAFKREADLIVANRQAAVLADVPEKVYTRDLFGRDI